MGEMDYIDCAEPRVPIITLTGLNPLTNLLKELPLSVAEPQPLEISRSLLFYPKFSEQAQSMLDDCSDTLVLELVRSIKQTSASHIVVKDKYHATEFKCDELEDLPRLLRLMLNIDPHLFKETTPTKTAEQCLSAGQPAQQTKVEQEVVQSLNVHKRPAEEKNQKDTGQPSSPEYSEVSSDEDPPGIPHKRSRILSLSVTLIS